MLGHHGQVSRNFRANPTTPPANNNDKVHDHYACADKTSDHNSLEDGFVQTDEKADAGATTGIYRDGGQRHGTTDTCRRADHLCYERNWFHGSSNFDIPRLGTQSARPKPPLPTRTSDAVNFGKLPDRPKERGRTLAPLPAIAILEAAKQTRERREIMSSKPKNKIEKAKGYIVATTGPSSQTAPARHTDVCRGCPQWPSRRPHPFSNLQRPCPYCRARQTRKLAFHPNSSRSQR